MSNRPYNRRKWPKWLVQQRAPKAMATHAEIHAKVHQIDKRVKELIADPELNAHLEWLKENNCVAALVCHLEVGVPMCDHQAAATEPVTVPTLSDDEFLKAMHISAE